ncbi:MAG TPA: protein-glutamate O-methyltransferase CheR [bacterium]|jgi:chemotaxis protein methyltransferase CheR|nr:protein-glutamate O-methyltransferase CheR [bacterium]
MEQELLPRDFERLSGLVFESSGIHLKPEKAELLRSRLSRRLRSLGLDSFDAYWQLLRRDDGEELRRMLDQVTTNKTEFFREDAHFGHLAKEALPGLRVRRNGRPLRLWSAACSSGEEPYSLAMCLAEALGPQTPFSVVATDLSEQMLDKAVAGAYSGESCKRLPRELRAKYFQPLPDGGWQVGPFLRSRVAFARFNLVRDPIPASTLEPFDVILCRNVMIYFDRPTQEAVVGRMLTVLRPDGWLYTGLSESLVGIRHGLRSEGPSIYRPADAPRR